MAPLVEIARPGHRVGIHGVVQPYNNIARSSVRSRSRVECSRYSSLVEVGQRDCAKTAHGDTGVATKKRKAQSEKKGKEKEKEKKRKEDSSCNGR